MRSNPDQTLAEYRAAMRPRSSAKIAHHTERPFEYVPSGHPVAVLPGDGSLLAASTARRADLAARDYGRAYLAYVLASDAGRITESDRMALNDARRALLSVVHIGLPAVTTDDAGRTVTTDDAGHTVRTMPAFSDVQLAACRTCGPDRYGRHLTGEPDTY